MLWAWIDRDSCANEEYLVPSAGALCVFQQELREERQGTDLKQKAPSSVRCVVGE